MKMSFLSSRSIFQDFFESNSKMGAKFGGNKCCFIFGLSTGADVINKFCVGCRRSSVDSILPLPPGSNPKDTIYAFFNLR